MHIKKVCQRLKPILLQPIGKVVVVVPEEYTGAIMGDFSKRGGMIMGMELNDEGDQRIEAEVPMAAMMKYPTELRSMTQGRGTYEIAFDRYEPAPKDVSDRVIRDAQREANEE